MKIPRWVRYLIAGGLVLAAGVAGIGWASERAETERLQAVADSSRAELERRTEIADSLSNVVARSDSVEERLRDSLSTAREEAAQNASEAAEGVQLADEDFQALGDSVDVALQVLAEKVRVALTPFVSRVAVGVDSMENAHGRSLMNHERFREAMENQVSLLTRENESLERSCAIRDTLIASQDSALTACERALADSEALVAHLQPSFLDLFTSDLPKTAAQLAGCAAAGWLADQAEDGAGPWTGGACTAGVIVARVW